MDPGIINVSCLLTEAGRRDFSYFETFWSEFKLENGQLAQNKADSKLTPTVFILLCIVFVIHLHCICFVLELYLYHGKKSICVGGKLTLLAVSHPVVTISRLNFGQLTRCRFIVASKASSSLVFLWYSRCICIHLELYLSQTLTPSSFSS